MENEKKTSLYDFIAAAVVDGQLPEDFSLPSTGTDDSQIKWMDGTRDGVFIYHMGPPEISNENRTLMADAVRAASEKDFESADQLFDRLGQEVYVVRIIDDLQSYIIDHKSDLSAHNIFEYGIHAILHSEDRECVKIGLSLLELFDTDEDDALKKVVRTLGLSDEFSIFAIFVMLCWEDGNDEVYRLARRIRGWGRIHAIERIEPTTEEIKRWLLTEGVHNAVLPAYSALTCWRKSDAENVLRNNPSREEFSGIRDIIEGLLDEGPVSGISEIENADEMILTFLKQTAAFEPELDDYEVIRDIRIHFEGKDSADPAIVSLCQELLASDRCRMLVSNAVKRGLAIGLAQDLKLDFKDDIMELLRTSFDDQFYLCNILMPDPKYKDAVLEIFRQNLPLDEMKTEPTNSHGLGQKFQKQHYLECILQQLQRYPLECPEFVETALCSAPVRTRNSGLAVLEAWVGAKGQLLAELMPETHSLLRGLREIEPDENVKSRMDRLIDGTVLSGDSAG